MEVLLIYRGMTNVRVSLGINDTIFSLIYFN